MLSSDQIAILAAVALFVSGSHASNIYPRDPSASSSSSIVMSSSVTKLNSSVMLSISKMSSSSLSNSAISSTSLSLLSTIKVANDLPSSKSSSLTVSVPHSTGTPSTPSSSIKAGDDLKSSKSSSSTKASISSSSLSSSSKKTTVSSSSSMSSSSTKAIISSTSSISSKKSASSSVPSFSPSMSKLVNTSISKISPSPTITTKPKASSKSMNITSCTPASWSYLGDPLIDAYETGGEAAFFSESLSEVRKMNTDAALFEKVFAGSTLSNSAASSSYITSLYYALQSEREFLWGTDGDAAVNFEDMMTDGCLFTTCTNQYWSKSKSFVKAKHTGLFWYDASPPCCGQCTIYAHGVQLSYWPTPAPTPPVTKLVDFKNYTYYSPLVYASFTGVYGWNECGYVGNSIYNAIGTFLPNYLRTSSIDRSVSTVDTQQWTTINYADFGPQCTCTTKCKTDPSIGVITDLCTPQMSLPSILTVLDPVWSICVMGFLGVFDPPVALTVQQGLSTPRTTSPPPILPPTTPTAQPVQTPTQPLGTPTAQPETTNPPAAPTSNTVSIVSSTIPNSGAPPPHLTSSTPPFIITPNITPTVIIIGTETFTPPTTQPTSPPLIINGQTITPGSGPITIAGQTITANSQGNYVVGTQTITPGAGPVTISQPPIIIAGQTITANAQGDYVIVSQTLKPGGTAITVSGSTISLAAGASDIVVIGASTTSTQNLGSVILSFIGGLPTSVTGTASAPAQYTGAAGKGTDWLGNKRLRGVVGFVGAALLF